MYAGHRRKRAWPGAVHPVEELWVCSEESAGIQSQTVLRNLKDAKQTHEQCQAEGTASPSKQGSGVSDFPLYFSVACSAHPSAKNNCGI